jgi:predicted dehydrogenase
MENRTSSTQISINPENPVRLAYVGAGFLAQNAHLPNFSSLPECRLLALAERRGNLARKVAQRFAIPIVYADHSELAANSEIEAVAVSADYAGQGEIAADLLLAGKSVFMEKPMAVSVRQAERILAAEREGKGRLMVGYMKRYDPGNRLVRELVRDWRGDGSKGKLLYVRSHGFCGNWIAGLDTSALIRSDEPIAATSLESLLPSWLPLENQRGYVAYLQQYTHHVNLLRFLLDAYSESDIRVRKVDFEEDGYTGIVVLEIKGIRCLIESASTRFHGWDEHTQLFFEGGWIRSTPSLLFSRPSANEVEVYEAEAGYCYPVSPVNDTWHYRSEAKHFLACVRSGLEFESNGRDALLDVRIFEQIYEKFIQFAN